MAKKVSLWILALTVILWSGCSSSAVNKTNLQTIENSNTVTTVLDDFTGVSRIQFSGYDESWGSLITEKYSKTGLSEKGWAYLEFSARMDSERIITEWRDSDLNFYIKFDTARKPGKYDGFTADIYPENFSKVFLLLSQKQGNEENFFSVPVSLNPGEWNHLAVPFAVLTNISESDSFNKNKPVSISFTVPFTENYSLFFFRGKEGFKGKLKIDNLGFFKFKTPPAGPDIETFDTEVASAVPEVTIGGTAFYVDYNSSEDGILKENPGVTGTSVKIERIPEGVSGSGLRIKGSIGINKDIKQFLDDGQEMMITVTFRTGKSWEGFNTYTGFTRTEGVGEGYIQFFDADTGYSYEYPITTRRTWGITAVPLEELINDESSFTADSISSPHQWIRYYFPVNIEQLSGTEDTGSFDFTLDFDQIILENR